MPDEVLQKYIKKTYVSHDSLMYCVQFEKWTVLNKPMEQLQVFQVNCLLFTCGYTLSDWQHIGPIMAETQQAYYAF